jgi:hypothetical protein
MPKGNIDVILDAIRVALTRWKLLAACIACFVLVILFLAFYYAPYVAIGPAQPIAFSHQVHAGVKAIDCRFCHPYVDRSPFPGIPPVEKCLYCHNYIISRHPEIMKEHRYFETGTPTPWIKVNYIPEHAFFNHQPHMRRNIECAECHGNVERLDRLTKKTWWMEECITCHRREKANLDCWLACHN